MNKNSLKITAAVLTLSSLAFAGQENKGVGNPTIKTYAAVCTLTKQNGSVQVLKTSDSKFSVKVTLDAGLASEKSEVYSAKQVAHDPHLLGAPLEYSGRGVNVNIVVDAAPTPKGSYSTITAADLGLQNAPAFCKLDVKQ